MRKILLLGWLMAAALSVGAQQQTISLGPSAVLLNGPWRFSPGDSPWFGSQSNGDFLWAQPAFDDSAWASMDLTPPAHSLDLQFGNTSFLPGWTTRGYPNLHGYAWYRLRLRVQDPGEPLWLSMPIDVDDGYQVFANGRYLGQFGEFGPRSVRLHYGHPAMFELPPIPPGGTIEIALRFYMSSVSALRWPQAGGLHGTPLLGLATAVDFRGSFDTQALLLGWLGDTAGALFCLLALPAALWALFRNRRDRVWLWLTLALACNCAAGVAQGLGVLASQSISMWAGEFWCNCVFMPALQFCWTLVWWHWFGLEHHRWIPRAAAILTVLYFLADFGFESPVLGFAFASQPLLHTCDAAIVWIASALGILLLVILLQGFRKDRTAALLATVPILLLEVSGFYVPLLVSVHFGPQFYIGPVGVQYNSLAPICMIVIVGVLSTRRFLANRDREVVERESVARDLEQARQLQQRVLVVEPVRSGAYKTYVAYRPAQTVGGDFFQTIANPDGTLLLVIGDVSGKGISAAMLVAVLVGGARARARQTSDPAAILAELNAQMIGRSGGHFATCLVAALSHDGNLRLANAGHLPPYRNGRELEMEGSLPLGMTEHLEPVIQIFRLDPDDTLTFLSDGVVEAQNERRELFGFDRTREISTQSAEAIADAAQSFGQEDDITVLTLTFAPAEVLLA